MSISNFIYFKKPVKSFENLSKSHKNKVISKFNDLFYLISNGIISSLTSYLCESKFGLEFIFPFYFEKYTKPILANIKDLYNKSPVSQKPSILSLIASQFSYQDLLKHEFQISKNQYYRAKKINRCNKATLLPYEKVIPKSKQKINNEQITKIVQICQENSTISSDSNIKKCKPFAFKIAGYSQSINYCLNYFKKIIFSFLKKNFPTIKFQNQHFINISLKTLFLQRSKLIYIRFAILKKRLKEIIKIMIYYLIIEKLNQL